MAAGEMLDPVLLWPKGAPRAKGNDPEDRPHLIPFLLPGPEKRPAIVVCPGGGYAGRAEHEGEPVAEWLNTLGLSACELHVFPSGPHGLGLAADHPTVSVWPELCARWLKDTGFRK